MRISIILKPSGADSTLHAAPEERKLAQSFYDFVRPVIKELAAKAGEWGSSIGMSSSSEDEENDS